MTEIEVAPVGERVIFSTLGVCSVEVHGGVASAIPSNLFRTATFILLSGNNVTISRQRLAALFWPDAHHEQAAANLRQSLARIRRFQDEHRFRLVEASFTLVRLDVSGIEWDLYELLKALSGEGEVALADVCRLYNGDLLADIPESGAEFEDWLTEQRVLLRESVIAKLAESLGAGGTLSSQLRSKCARKLLSIDPGNEQAFQTLMREAADNGDYARLRQIYAKCEQYLMKEFGVAISHKTRSLYAQLLADQARS